MIPPVVRVGPPPVSRGDLVILTAEGWGIARWSLGNDIRGPALIDRERLRFTVPEAVLAWMPADGS